MITNIIKGSLIGVALIVPGLSGSIFAIILGLYEKGLYAVANFIREPIVHGKFLLPIAVGGGIGVLVGAWLVLSLTVRFPAFAYLFFCGLVIGSGPLVYRKLMQVPLRPLYLLYSVAAFFVVFVFVYANIENAHTTLYRIGSVFDFFNLAFAGLVSVPLMMIPGVSSSIIIIVLGHFGTIYNSIGAIVDMVRYMFMGYWAGFWDSFAAVVVLVPFVVGAVVGFITMARIMSYLLKRFEVIIYYFVAGALIGTIGVLFDMGVIGNIPYGFVPFVSFLVIGLICVACGIFCTIFLERRDRRNGLDRG